MHIIYDRHEAAAGVEKPWFTRPSVGTWVAVIITIKMMMIMIMIMLVIVT